MQRLTPPCALFVSMLVACSGDNAGTDAARPPSDRGPVDRPREISVDARAKADMPQPPDAGPRVDYCGILSSSGGKALANVGVIICDPHTCFSDTTDAKGSFCIAVNAAGDLMLHIGEVKTGADHFGDVIFPLAVSAAELAKGGQKDLGTLHAPAMGPAVTLDPASGGTLDLGSGAKLVVPPGVAAPPPLSSSCEVAFASVVSAQVHPNLLGSYPGQGTLVATRVLVPRETSFSSPISYVLPGPGSLPAGTGLVVYRADEITGKLGKDGEATVNASGMLTDVPGKGLRGLGWLLFYKE